MIFLGDTDARPRACVITWKESHAHLLPYLSDGVQVAVQINLGHTTNPRCFVVASVYMPYNSSFAPPGKLFEDLLMHCKTNNIPLLAATLTLNASSGPSNGAGSVTKIHYPTTDIWESLNELNYCKEKVFGVQLRLNFSYFYSK